MNSSTKDSHSQRVPSKAKSRSSLFLSHGPRAKDEVANSKQPGDDLLEGRLPGVDQDPRAEHAARRRQEQPEAQVLAHRLQLMAVDHSAHHVGRQHGHEVGGIGLDLRHARRQQQGKGHEARAARHHVDEARQQAAGEEEDDVEKVQGGLVGTGSARYGGSAGPLRNPRRHI